MKLNRTGVAEELPYNDINQKVSGWSLNREGFLNYRNTQVDLDSSASYSDSDRVIVKCWCFNIVLLCLCFLCALFSSVLSV